MSDAAGRLEAPEFKRGPGGRPTREEAERRHRSLLDAATELFLEGRWVKATPAFNLGLCQRFGVLPLEFDGRNDSIFHPFDAENRRHMEYVRSHGSFADFPFEQVMAAFRREYPSLFGNLQAGPVRDELFRPSGSERR